MVGFVGLWARLAVQLPQNVFHTFGSGLNCPLLSFIHESMQSRAAANSPRGWAKKQLEREHVWV